MLTFPSPAAEGSENGNAEAQLDTPEANAARSVVCGNLAERSDDGLN